jgi:hypothetical protein
MRRIFFALLLAFFAITPASAANFYWKSSTTDLNAIAAPSAGDRGIVITDAGAVSYWTYSGSAWVQAYASLDATLTALGGLTITQGSLIYGTGTDAFSILSKGTAGQLLRMNTGATAPEWFTPSYQAADADLTTYAGITPSANVQSFLGAADYSAMRTALSLVPGTNVQAYDADLTTYAGITPSANAQTLLTRTFAQMLSDIGAAAGPASSTDNAIARFDSTTGKLLQNSSATIDDSGNISATSYSSTAADAFRRMELGNNTSAWSGCSSGVYGMSFDAGVLKICENGSKRSVLSAATVADGDKGDITVSNSGATWTIDNGAVTAAKIESSPALNASNMTNFPTLNQSTTGSAASVKSPSTTGVTRFTGPTAGTTRDKTVRDANDTLLELGGSYTPTGTWNWASASVTWPTFNQSTSGTAAIATTTTTANEATDTTCFPTFVTAATGDLGQKTNSGLTFNSATGVLGATGFSGPLTGNVTGTATGLSGTPALPNGTTATTQTAGDNSTKVATTAYVATAVSGAGYATLGANTFTGTQALGANNLTMTGSIAATGARVTKGWFTDIESTNMPTVGGVSLSTTFAPKADPVFTGSLQLPNGANPVTDAAGEIAVDTSTGAGQGVRAYGAVAFTLPAYQTKCTTINAATASSDFLVERLPYAITIRAAHVMQLGATNVVGHFDECDGNGANCAGIDGATDITATTTNANDDGSLSNATIDANDYIQWHTTSVSGTNTQTIVCFDYTVDQAN